MPVTIPTALSAKIDAINAEVGGKKLTTEQAAIAILSELFAEPYGESHRGKPANVAAAKATIEASKNPALADMFTSADMKKKLAAAKEVVANAEATQSVPNIIPSANLSTALKRK